MHNASGRYLREVLGVTSIVLPEDVSPVSVSKPAGHFQVSGDFNAPTAVVSFSPVAFSERELCQKMLMAVGGGPLLLIEFSTNEDNEAFQEFFGAYKGKQVWSFGSPSQDFLHRASGLRVLTLPSLSELTDQSDPAALMAKKRDVWAKIQNFQKADGG